MTSDDRRLIYVIGTFPSLTTTFIDREVRALRRVGVDVQVVSMRRPPADLPLSTEQVEAAEGALYLFPMHWRRLLAAQLYFGARHPRRLLSALAYLVTRPHPDRRAWLMTLAHFGEGVYAAYLVRDRPFRELHAHFADRAATIALIMSRLFAKPYSLSIHAGADIYVSPVLLPEKILGARHVVTCTAYNRAYLERLLDCDLEKQVSCIRHGLELEKYSAQSRAADSLPIILAVGQLAERKGLADLVRSCGLLRDRGYQFVCHIVGQGPQRPELERLIADLGLEQIVLLCGPLPHEAVIEAYARAALFVLPCRQTKEGDIDGIPNVLPEAMAMGVPVVSTHLSAIPELIYDGENGLLVPPDDPAALAEKMAVLLTQPALREELGRNGRRTALEMFDVAQNVGRFAATLWPDWFVK
jgi:glycosyltransferase involved in cell wall biosynthesis